MEVKVYVTNTPVFTKYHDIMEEYLEEYTDKFVKRELKKYSELNPALENEIYSEFFYIAEEFPILLRYSFLVTCYSYLEHEFIKECKIQKKSKSLQLNVTDLNGNGIKRAKDYLIKVANIDFQIDESWNEIMNIAEIRNSIVHSEGFLNDSKKAEKIKNYISRRHDISIENDKIILSADYCRYVINIISKILRNLKT